MRRIRVSIAALLATVSAGAQDIPFVPGQEPPGGLSDTDKSAALAAIDALAAELQVPKEKIEVDTVRAVEWRDSSIGCPKPGLAYLDVITPGHKVTLRADGQLYVVHEAGSRAIVCRQAKALGGIPPQWERVFGPQLVEARRDLASRIGVPEPEIRFVGAVGKTFSDASLDCPDPGVEYAKANVHGWVLRFSHDNREYSYHTDLKRTIPCPPIATD
jgi:hypothetical protein